MSFDKSIFLYKKTLGVPYSLIDSSDITKETPGISLSRVFNSQINAFPIPSTAPVKMQGLTLTSYIDINYNITSSATNAYGTVYTSKTYPWIQYISELKFNSDLEQTSGYSYGPSNFLVNCIPSNYDPVGTYAITITPSLGLYGSVGTGVGIVPPSEYIIEKDAGYIYFINKNWKNKTSNAFPVISFYRYNGTIGIPTNLGTFAGAYNQGDGAIAYGNYAGCTGQGTNSVSIGQYAGQFRQGTGSIAIGYLAGPTGMQRNSIALNASELPLFATGPTGGFYVAPVGSYSGSVGPFTLLAYGADKQIVTVTNATGISLSYLSINNTLSAQGLSGGSGTFSTLNVTGMNVGSLTGSTGTFNYLSINNTLSVQGLSGGSGTFSTLNVTGMNVGSLTGSTGTFNYLSINNINISLGQNAGQTGAVNIGYKAGQYKQGTGSIAIGYLSGPTGMQSNSIALNASELPLFATGPTGGFYVAPVSSYSGSVGPFTLLAYGADKQIVSVTGTVLTNMGIGGGGGSNLTNDGSTLTLCNDAGDLRLSAKSNSPYIYLNNSTGYVGIGTTIPLYTLDVNGTCRISGPVITNSTTAIGYWLPSNGITSIYITDTSANVSTPATTLGRYFGTGGALYQDFYGSFNWRASTGLNSGLVTTAMSLTNTALTVSANLNATNITATNNINGASIIGSVSLSAPSVSATNINGTNVIGSSVVNGLNITASGSLNGPVGNITTVNSSTLNVTGVTTLGTLNVSGSITSTGTDPLYLANNCTIWVKNFAGANKVFLHPIYSDNVTYINYGSAGWNIRNNAGTNTMFMTNDGSVGIGTTSPSYKLDVNGTCRISGTTTLSSTLNVTGVTTLGTLNVNGVTNTGVTNLFVLNVTGVTTLGTLNAGVTTLSSTLNVTGATTLSSTLNVTGATTLTSNLKITGINFLEFGFGNTKEANAGKIGYGTFTSDCLDIVGAGTGSNRKVKIYDDLIVGGATSVSTTLNVSGATTLGTLNSGVTSLSNTLNVSGVTTLSSILNVYGATNLLSALDVNGITNLSSRLNVTGNTKMDGYLSIGTSTLSFPLHVVSSCSHYWNLGTLLDYEGNRYIAFEYTWSVSIWATSAIVTEQWFGTSSDIRIKKNIQPVKPMLDIINKIEIVSFDFIDPITHKRDECGVIAQQLKEHFPNAVDTSIGIIPCYMTKGTYTIQDDKLTILFDCKNEHLKIGDKVNILSGIYHIELEKSTNNDSETVEVLELVEGGFVCKKWLKFSEDIEIIVYGKQVDDFHNVDKEQLGVLALKGVQELHSIIKEQDIQIKEQNKTINTILDQIAQLTETVNKLSK